MVDRRHGHPPSRAPEVGLGGWDGSIRLSHVRIALLMNRPLLEYVNESVDWRQVIIYEKGHKCVRISSLLFLLHFYHIDQDTYMYRQMN